MKDDLKSPSEKLYSKLKGQGLNFFVAVPCKLLAGIITLIENDPEVIYTPVTREEEGLGILAGAFLGGKRPAIVMQNSGMGNCINAICSLLNYYSLPIVFIVSHRGSEGEKIEAQKPMGEATRALLESVKVKSYEISAVDELHLIEVGVTECYKQQRPVAFLIPISFWEEVS